MCGRFGNSITQDEIQLALELDRWFGAPHTPRYNIRITQPAPVVLADDSGRFEDDYRWGLIFDGEHRTRSLVSAVRRMLDRDDAGRRAS